MSAIQFDRKAGYQKPRHDKTLAAQRAANSLSVSQQRTAYCLGNSTDALGFGGTVKAPGAIGAAGFAGVAGMVIVPGAAGFAGVAGIVGILVDMVEVLGAAGLLESTGAAWVPPPQ